MTFSRWLVTRFILRSSEIFLKTAVKRLQVQEIGVKDTLWEGSQNFLI
ncbi:hypothetical protein TSACC_3597 [Terrimicrobium sacchariphilum]|uniref:Uncharacterized protein n=1 Tax=Terrimicrobium sacchariphilum TaxID=690879 RepID=A0A146GG12_TERSA|nr:hypothetical protein TSACC_3597 [Terrimicrobium sacchariphilum]